MSSPAALFLQSFESLIEDRLLKIKNIDFNHEAKKTELIVNSRLTSQSFCSIQKDFKELLQRELSNDVTIHLSYISISLHDLYYVSPYKDSKRSKVRDPLGLMTDEDVEVLASATKKQNSAFSSVFCKYKLILEESNARKKVDNIEAISKKKRQHDTVAEVVLVASAKETTKGVGGADETPELNDSGTSDTASIPSSRKNKRAKRGAKKVNINKLFNVN